MEESIKTVLKDCAKESHEQMLKSDKEWTQLIKKRLGELGVNSDYSIATGGFQEDFEREWLYDMTWYKEIGEGKNKRLTNIPLVV
jgi:hypothetical protein